MNATMSRTDKIAYRDLLEERGRRLRYNAIKRYKPYPKQAEFHAHGLKYDERCLGAGNQLGKTLAGSMESAYHLTGCYPDDWRGRVIPHANVGWVGGVTGEVIRDTTQKLLVGRLQRGPDELGTGSIPRDCIIDVVKGPMGDKGSLDHVKVRHKDRGISLAYFKSYATGREKWQGDTIDWYWYDEEPPYDIYSEGKTRTNKGQVGRFGWMTFTPLLGMTDVVNQFYKKPTSVQKLIMMTINDVGHYTDEEKKNIIAGYEDWELDARINGIPTLGSGRIFRYKEEDIRERHISDIPKHWALLNGLDFGWDHPQACVQIAWDKDEDVIHVIRGRKARETKPLEMWAMVRAWADGIPTAWPHDGFSHDKGSGKQLAEQYSDVGFDMHHEHTTHEEGGFGVEAALTEMHDRFSSKRLRVDEGLEEFWEEFRLYHRKNGVIVKLNDDFISALRYAIMMKRYAKSRAELEYVYEEPIFETDFPR